MRNIRRARANGRPLECELCRVYRVPTQATEPLRNWWLDRYSLEEIREMAEALTRA